MKLSSLICPSCGGDKLEARENGAFCPHCGGVFAAGFLDEQEALLKALGAAKEEGLAHARRMLYDAVRAENVSSERVTAAAREVKKYAPDDFLANFYEAACDSDVRTVNRFLDGVDAEKQGRSFLTDVCKFMLASLEKRNLVSFKAFLERAHLAGVFDGGEYTAYFTRTEKEAEKLDSGVYDADLPRDVFLAYSSKDMAEVNALADYLEEEGFSCFVALRNLRHGKGAAENYQRLLETAMRNCKSVVFVSTENSRDLDCDALDKEIPYFREHRADIYRVEYRPESDSGKTTRGAKILLEAFFEDLEYARTPEDVLDRLINHKYGLDKSAPQVEAQPAPQPKPAPAPTPQKEVQPVPQAEVQPVPYKTVRKKKRFSLAAGWFCFIGEIADMVGRHSAAANFYRKAAKRGDVEAQCNLGVCYGNGYGVPQSYEKAVEWYTEAAEQGYKWAQNYLGDCYYYGYGVSQSYEKAVEWYTKAAKKRLGEAQCDLGYCYENGYGVPQSYEKAVYWYTKAAKKRLREAQNNLGVCYENGYGVPQSYEKAVEWYTKAAKKGNVWAQYNLGECYEKGQGVPQSHKKAVYWYIRAAEQDDADAQYNLGECYENGRGVTQDIAKAIEWYKKAAAQGNDSAKRALGRLKK